MRHFRHGSLQMLRWVVWASAAMGVFIAFGWPFLIGTDPDDASLRVLARATTGVLLVTLGVAAVLRARSASEKR